MLRCLTVRARTAVVAAGLVSSLLVLASSAGAAGTLVAYNVYPLVADSSASAPLADSALVNGWGLSATATSPWWVSDNKTNLSTLYSGVGSKSATTVTVPGGPTGTVANPSTTDFAISQNGVTGVSRFLFDTASGQILGWAPTVSAASAVVAVDASSSHAMFQGLAVANDRLYATDFHNAKVDAYDATFQPLSLGFSDPGIPKGWAPFGIQALNGNIFVTYAQQDPKTSAVVPGSGQGYVDEFTPDGKLVARVASKGTAKAPLNAPWGLAMAPSNFGAYSGDLLVGNFGNGRISAYLQLPTGKWVYKGQIRVASGAPIVLDGLWAIAFGNGASAGPTNNLYFAAGPQGQAHGLFGFIAVG
jgi:uncharacterized protein (TIGR03118 family)